MRPSAHLGRGTEYGCLFRRAPSRFRRQNGSPLQPLPKACYVDCRLHECSNSRMLAGKQPLERALIVLVESPNLSLRNGPAARRDLRRSAAAIRYRLPARSPRGTRQSFGLTQARDALYLRLERAAPTLVVASIGDNLQRKARHKGLAGRLATCQTRCHGLRDRELPPGGSHHLQYETWT